jgi:hypothetical protein
MDHLIMKKTRADSESSSSEEESRSNEYRCMDVVLRIRENGGHFGTPSQQIEELTEDYAFLLEVMKKRVPPVKVV